MLAPLPLVLKDRVIKKYTLFFLRDVPLFNTKVDTRETNSIDKRARNARK